MTESQAAGGTCTICILTALSADIYFLELLLSINRLYIRFLNFLNYLETLKTLEEILFAETKLFVSWVNMHFKNQC